MAKSSGLGWKFYIDGVDLSGDTASLDAVRTPQATLPATGIDKEAMERMPGQLDGAVDWTSWFNDAASQQHVTLRSNTTGDRYLMGHAPDAIGAVGFATVARQVDYGSSRSAEGALQFKIPTLADGFRLEHGRLLTSGKRTDGSATNGSSYDYGAAVGTTAFGLQMYWQLFSFTGTSVTLTVQSSTDNGAGDAFATVTGATSGALTAVGGGRVATATNVNVERYLRLVTTGTFSNAVFAVLVVRNKAVPTF